MMPCSAEDFGYAYTLLLQATYILLSEYLAPSQRTASAAVTPTQCEEGVTFKPTDLPQASSGQPPQRHQSDTQACPARLIVKDTREHEESFSFPPTLPASQDPDSSLAAWLPRAQATATASQPQRWPEGGHEEGATQPLLTSRSHSFNSFGTLEVPESPPKAAMTVVVTGGKGCQGCGLCSGASGAALKLRAGLSAAAEMMLYASLTCLPPLLLLVAYSRQGECVKEGIQQSRAWLSTQAIMAWLLVISGTEFALTGSLVLCTQANSALTTTGDAKGGGQG